MIIMSILIQQLDAYFRPHCVGKKKHYQIESPSIQSNQNQQIDSNIKIEEQISFKILPSTKISLRKRGTFSQKTSLLRIQIHTVVGQYNYLKVQDRDRQMLLYQLCFNKLKSRCEDYIQVSLHPKSGIVKIVIIVKFVSCTNRNQEILRSFLRQSAELKGLREIISYGIKGKIFQQTTRKHVNFQRVIAKLGSGLIYNQYQAQSKLQQNLRAQNIHKEKILSNLIKLTKEEANAISLYSSYQFHDFRWGYFFSQQQINHIFTQKIRSPVLNKPKTFFQNSSILNYIKINNIQSLRMSKLKSGGFSNLFLTQLQYWYVFSGTQNDPITPLSNNPFPPQTMLKKLVVMKCDGQINTLRNRIKHEKDILRMMKNGHALFVPKYYLPLKQPTNSKELFVDFISAPSLEEYSVIHRNTISLPTKILIILMIVHGMRFIHGFQITHLDLKPQNILLPKNLMPKIIDFGESYHHKVCKEDFVPGFTHPYGAPECYYPTDLKIFGPHNDIFSLGVISFQLLFSRFPYYCHDENQLDRRYLNLNLDKYFYFCSQARENYGDSTIDSLLQLVLGRCLDIDCSRRPDLNWISLILREMLDYFYFYYL